MIRPPYAGNRRILIDDTPAIHQDFRKTLDPGQDGQALLADTEAALFGDAPLAGPSFELDSAYLGQEALTVKWQMTQDAAMKMSALEQAVEERTKELSDANIIVRNSSTILYCLRGEPSFPLMYISHNITKFDHDAAQLLASPNWAQELVHPDDQEMFDTAMARVLEKSAQGASIEFRLLTGAEAYRWVENRYIPVRNKEGRLIEIEGIVLDITERKLAEEKIALLARTDSLTGLADRATFIERLRQVFAAAERGAPSFAIFYLDLDHFKEVNDSLGHPVGDLLLQKVARRIGSCTRESDLVARLGGDEFAIAQTNMGEPANAGVLAQTKWTRNDVLPQLRERGVKIAQSFINSATDATTLRAIIAEGVETREQRAPLISAGSTTEAQGFYFSMAMDNRRAGELLRRGHITPQAPNDEAGLAYASFLEPPQDRS
ncbi:MAG TPA: diguanylate cyclase [Pseudomonas sp.]|nr:diguanylate cyclase [Pseudomonas sp.]HUE90980.1 diguanylate cyclase [Pseudomonas sp.]